MTIEILGKKSIVTAYYQNLMRFKANKTTNIY